MNTISLNNISWNCTICKASRPDAKISVFSSDISSQHNLPPGSVQSNVRYCNDNDDCRKKAFNTVNPS